MRHLQYLWNRLGRLFGNRRDGLDVMHARGTKQFIIFNPAWPDPPKHWYSTIDEALVDAEDLAKKQPQDTFYVLKAIQAVSIGPIVVRELPSGPEGN